MGKNASENPKSKSSLIGKLFSILKRNEPKTPVNKQSEGARRIEKVIEKSQDTIEKSNYISRDLSWLKFDERVLEQARSPKRSLFDKLKFLAITSSNLDEFFTIRVGSLYNYIDFGKERTDYSGLREIPFKHTLMKSARKLSLEKHRIFSEELAPKFKENGLVLASLGDLQASELEEVNEYFHRTIYPMLTPMVFDHTHTFPSLLAKTLIFGVVTEGTDDLLSMPKKQNAPLKAKKISFVQIPQNLNRFYIIERDDEVVFVPIEEIIRRNIKKLYRNVEIISTSLFRITRNGDFDIVEQEDTDVDFIDEIKKKIKDRRLGRVTRIEVEQGFSEYLLDEMLRIWNLGNEDIFDKPNLLDFTCFFPTFKASKFQIKIGSNTSRWAANGFESPKIPNIFQAIREGDILLHHPYQSFEPVLQLLEQAAEDAKVLAIKITLYRISKNSRIADALLRAAENGKHVSVLFEVKARFDEENNIREAQRLQKAGCFVIYGIPGLKTHTKLLQVIRNEGEKVVGYAHLSSGNYNEDTAKLYTDIGLLTTDEVITRDIAEFFNVITGHSIPLKYENLITAPRDMRNRLVEMVRNEAKKARAGLPSGICLKINSLQDKIFIDELYSASEAGVPIELIVRGVCCLRPQRKGLSENIKVRSIIGDFLEHTRIYYFHNQGEPLVYGGSADVMVRSFDRRIESLFQITHTKVLQMAITILAWNLKDNQNAYQMQENGSYLKAETDDTPFSIHERFYNISEEDTIGVNLFGEEAIASKSL